MNYDSSDSSGELLDSSACFFFLDFFFVRPFSLFQWISGYLFSWIRVRVRVLEKSSTFLTYFSRSC